MRENIRLWGGVDETGGPDVGRASDLLVRDGLRTFVLFLVFHGFIERRVAEEVACGRGG